MQDPYIKYRKGYKYQLVEDYHFQTRIRPEVDIFTHFINLNTKGQGKVRCDYAWDGPSGPTIDTKDAMRGSLGHDAKSQLIRLCLLPYSDKKIADHEIEEDCIKDGMWKWRAKIWHWTLEKFGRASVMPSWARPALTAP